MVAECPVRKAMRKTSDIPNFQEYPMFPDVFFHSYKKIAYTYRV
jgi:hypothetical protein